MFYINIMELGSMSYKALEEAGHRKIDGSATLSIIDQITFTYRLYFY